MTDDWTEADDVIEEIWEIRRRTWARFDNDPERVFNHFLEVDRERRSNERRRGITPSRSRSRED